MEVALKKANAYQRKSSSQIDMELLSKGTEYRNLPNAYVIFICDYDPFGKGKYRYIFRNNCQEVDDIELLDGSYTIFLNTHGENRQDVSKELANFLDFVKRDSCDTTFDFEDEYVKKIQKSICAIKQSREMGERFMLLEIVLRNEWLEGREEGREEGRTAGRAEMILELLSELGHVSDEVRDIVMQEKDLDVLRKWAQLAVKSESLEAFVREIS